MVAWLLDEKGADVNATTRCGRTAVFSAASVDILNALLDRGGDPILPNPDGELPLMSRAQYREVDIVARLLQDPRVRATVNMQDQHGNIALHHVCGVYGAERPSAPMAHLLLQAGADPLVTNKRGQTPLDEARRCHPTYHAVIALLEQYPEAKKDAEKALFLVKVRRLAIAAKSNTVAPSCLQARVARGQPLPRVLLRRVVLTPVAGGPDENEEGEEDRKLHSLYAFPLGIRGPQGKGMPPGVFEGVFMELLMPSWYPRRRKNAGTGPPAAQG